MRSQRYVLLESGVQIWRAANNCTSFHPRSVMLRINNTAKLSARCAHLSCGLLFVKTIPSSAHLSSVIRADETLDNIGTYYQF